MAATSASPSLHAVLSKELLQHQDLPLAQVLYQLNTSIQQQQKDAKMIKKLTKLQQILSNYQAQCKMLLDYVQQEWHADQIIFQRIGEMKNIEEGHHLGTLYQQQQQAPILQIDKYRSMQKLYMQLYNSMISFVQQNQSWYMAAIRKRLLQNAQFQWKRDKWLRKYKSVEQLCAHLLDKQDCGGEMVEHVRQLMQQNMTVDELLQQLQECKQIVQEENDDKWSSNVSRLELLRKHILPTVPPSSTTPNSNNSTNLNQILLNHLFHIP